MLRSSELLRLYGRTDNTFTCVIFNLSLTPVAFFSIDKDFTNQLCRISVSPFSDKALLNREFHLFCNNVPQMRTADWYVLSRENFVRFVEYSTTYYKTLDTERVHIQMLRSSI